MCEVTDWLTGSIYFQCSVHGPWAMVSQPRLQLCLDVNAAAAYRLPVYAYK